MNMKICRQFVCWMSMLLTGGTACTASSWTAGTANWYQSGNWDSGVPGSGVDAYVQNGGTAQIGTPASTATAANLYLGYNGAPANGYLQISSGALQVGGLIYLGYPYQKSGFITQTGGSVTANALTIAYSGSKYQIDAGSLTVATTLQVGAAYSTTTFLQNNGTVIVNGNLQLGASNQGGANNYTIQNGSLSVGGNVTSLSGPINWTQANGTVAVTGTFNLGPGGASGFTGSLQGGSLTAANMNVGDRYNTATTALFDQRGTDITVDGIVTVRGLNTDYRLRQGTLSIGKAGSLRIGGGDQYGAGRGTFTYNLNATGATSLTQHGTGSGASLILRSYNTGFGLGQVGNAVGTFRGWGTVGFTGTLNNSGRMIADGGGQEHTLDLSAFTTVANTFENLAANGATNTGWFARNRGRLELPALAITGSGTKNWGEAAADTSIDLVNSVRVTLNGVSGSGTLDIALLAPDHSSDISDGSRLGNPMGVWEFQPVGFTFGTADMIFRYDDAQALALGVDETSLKLFHFENGHWTNLTANVDTVNKWITVTGVTSFSDFFIGTHVIPEPSMVLLFLSGLGTLVWAWRRRK